MSEQSPASAEREPAEREPAEREPAEPEPAEPEPAEQPRDASGRAATAEGGTAHGQEVRHASGLEDPAALSEGLGDDATGDLAIDRALEDLKHAPPDDLDAQIEAGEQVNDTLKSRLSDLGGE